MGELCTCGDFIGEDPFCKEHGNRHGHWPVQTWDGDGGIELLDCPECGGIGEHDLSDNSVTCGGCGYSDRAPTISDAPETSR